MKKRSKVAEIVAVLCMVFAFISAGSELMEVLKDTLGYLIYIGVFLTPVIYFSMKRKQSMIPSA